MEKQTIHLQIDSEVKRQIDDLKEGNYSASAVIRAAIKNYHAQKNRNGKYND